MVLKKSHPEGRSGWDTQIRRQTTDCSLIVAQGYGAMQEQMEEKIMSELAEILEEEENLTEEPAVLDDASAEMMLDRIREANEEYERMAAWYDHQKAKIAEKRDRVVQWAELGLRSYFNYVPTHDTKTKRTYELPGATLTLAKQDPKFDVKDEIMVSWLEKNKRADLIKVKKEAEWGKLKKELQMKILEDGRVADKKTGEIIPGLTATVREDKFTVKLK